MNDTQFYVAIAIAPALSLLIVLGGIIIQNVNLNARLGELRTDIAGRFTDLAGRFDDTNSRIGDVRDLLRAEMAKNHSEMLHRFADLDSRLTRLEQKR